MTTPDHLSTPSEPQEEPTNESVGGVNLGSDNEQSDWEKQFAPDQFNWQIAVVESVRDEIIRNAGTLGYDQTMIDAWYSSLVPELVTYLESEVVAGFQAQSGVTNAQSPFGTGDLPAGVDPELGTAFPFRPEDYTHIITKFARNWVAGRGPSATALVSPNLAGAFTKRGGFGGGGGGGARKLTADEIRAQFDIDQLANAVQDMWQTYLFDDAKHPRAIARAYVDAVVATGGEKKIDFQTFVRKRIENQPRFSSIYRNKPQGVSADDYLRGYVDRAQGVLRPRNVQGAAVGAAQLGSSPLAFEERLSRSKEVQRSAPFITALEGRMTQLSKVFRG